jgi:hypothetical protein
MYVRHKVKCPKFNKDRSGNTFRGHLFSSFQVTNFGWVYFFFRSTTSACQIQAKNRKSSIEQQQQQTPHHFLIILKASEGRPPKSGHRQLLRKNFGFFSTPTTF